MRITWYGHSCFKIEAAEGSLILDPYSDGAVPGLKPLRVSADAVVCSHSHQDHNGVKNVALTGHPCTLSISHIDCFHDDALGALRGPNRIHIISGEGLKIAHLGDLGHALSDGQARELMGLDALLIPVGGYYTINAKAAEALLENLLPRVVLPMHFRKGRTGYPVIAGLDKFLALRTDVRVYDTNTLELTKDTPAQTAVLALQNV